MRQELVPEADTMLFDRIISFIVGIGLLICAGFEFRWQSAFEAKLLEEGTLSTHPITALGHEMTVFYIAVGLIFIVLAMPKLKGKANKDNPFWFQFADKSQPCPQCDCNNDSFVPSCCKQCGREFSFSERFFGTDFQRGKE